MSPISPNGSHIPPDYSGSNAGQQQCPAHNGRSTHTAGNGNNFQQHSADPNTGQQWPAHNGHSAHAIGHPPPPRQDDKRMRSWLQRFFSRNSGSSSSSSSSSSQLQPGYAGPSNPPPVRTPSPAHGESPVSEEPIDPEEVELFKAIEMSLAEVDKKETIDRAYEKFLTNVKHTSFIEAELEAADKFFKGMSDEEISALVSEISAESEQAGTGTSHNPSRPQGSGSPSNRPELDGMPIHELGPSAGSAQPTVPELDGTPVQRPVRPPAQGHVVHGFEDNRPPFGPDDVGRNRNP